jgi:predicted nucleic acid-binding protein
LDALHLACANQTGLTIVTGDKVLADAARSLDQPVQLLEP